MALPFKKLPARKRIALIAHDHRKADLLDWTRTHRDELRRHDPYATGTTGRILAESLDLEATGFLSGRSAEISRSERASREVAST